MSFEEALATMVLPGERRGPQLTPDQVSVIKSGLAVHLGEPTKKVWSKRTFHADRACVFMALNCLGYSVHAISKGFGYAKITITELLKKLDSRIKDCEVQDTKYQEIFDVVAGVVE